MRRRSLGRVLSSACVAAVIYGGWSFFANDGHGAAIATRVMLAQAATSFALTFVTTALIEGIHARVGRRRLGIAATILGTFGLLQGFNVAVHLAVGTPELLRTLAPNVIVGATFTTVYTLAVHRAIVRESAAGEPARAPALDPPQSKVAR